ncbi:hypothetical protein [Paracoccus aerius]|uniref:Flagellar hook-length control protein FliK n=1 Tax=Paracoccus aerius TaxID=1915382 RepID=A0ABS1S9Y2_9RHOB|nr:hypothetical protein [Paracoccus aerius]MBL3674527.1 hypothetical protein [Paracoccus aerius]GHG25569.1 hypothetical protein GCM10017322_24650 [Paracoccus aerius]
MVLGILKPVLNPLLTPAASNAAPNSAVGRAAAAAQAASEAAAQQASADKPASQPSPAQAPTDGVKFDLSDKALQLVGQAAASGPAVPAGSSAAAPATAASASSAAQAPARAPITSRGGASSTAPEPQPVSTSPKADPLEAVDPTEEERARAWAIRGMEREKLLNLVETLKVTPKADPAEKEVAQNAAAQPSVQASPAEKLATV